MPNFAGTWKMRSSENFDELLKALGVNAMLRKVAVAAASKPHVEIRQDGDQFYIKTSTTVRTTEINFKVGEGFEEETVDGRKCRRHVTWKVAVFLFSESRETQDYQSRLCTASAECKQKARHYPQIRARNRAYPLGRMRTRSTAHKLFWRGTAPKPTGPASWPTTNSS
uniref:Cellular retinoic acid binding protein 1 n=1 Tax=Bos mutus grunniens TaxID=30521 RepID=A0A8B9Y711_BOSMU